MFPFEQVLEEQRLRLVIFAEAGSFKGGRSLGHPRPRLGHDRGRADRRRPELVWAVFGNPTRREGVETAEEAGDEEISRRLG
jgi:hypothetical protein